MGLIRLGVALLAVSAAAANPELSDILRSVEARYNRAKTLEVSFIEHYTPTGRPQSTESGTLFLRKPGRMRCQYAKPQGKLCISDGTNLYLYTPSDNKAMKMKLKDSLAEDMRAPLAFLLGKLNFNREFRNLQAHPEGFRTRISGEPKNQIYNSIEFLVGSDSSIQELKIVAVDRSVLDFVFSDEKLDPALNEKMFAFQLPAGAQWDEGQ